jgi:hypothetical protein
MARFYDRVLEDGILPPAGMGGVSEYINPDLQRSTVVKIDNVAKWFFAGTDQEHWKIARDFPILLSPFENAWYEWFHDGFIRSEKYGDQWIPPATMGFLVRVFERGDYTQTFGFDVVEGYKRERNLTIAPRWIQEALLFLDAGKGKPARGPVSAWRIPIKVDGTPCTINDDEALYEMFPFMAMGRRPEEIDVIENGLISSIFPMYMAISLMHCNGVKQIKHDIPDKVQRKRERNGRPALSRYYTLEVDVFKEEVSSEGGVRSGGLKRVIHRRRGYFKNYTVDRPLFGKHVGRWFWGDRLVGTPALGEVKKDYSPKAPAKRLTND